ncbi:colonial-26 [Diaporthe amygdali]|uniref:colonial-26 n=1 Tax=Phomopsis amygdali TaxID=1214568 RepID=UPI0022FED5A8|nr:colonial-26 [Diaporthe amygdali]KAJ0108122.1 colonial-26 [Diaporthe amygdali]
MTSGTMTTAVKRACDACHRRKVKCDGVNPCRNCHTAQLGCTYHAIPQKKGPKGSRAKVISELRETQRQTSLSAQVQNRMNGINAPAAVPTLAPTPGLLTGDIVKECIEFFFANMYPSMPILSRQRLEQQAVYMDQNLDAYCLLAALSAFMMIQPGMTIPGDPYGLDSMPGANIVSSTVLLEETIRVRKGFDYTDNPTMNTLCTSYFLFACYYGLEMHEKAWFHLREASTMIQIIGMNKEEAYVQFDDVESARRRRLYWLFFVTERAYALHRNRPVTLQASINPPALADDPTDHMAHQLNSFIHLSNLFRPFDDAFLGMWSKNRSNWPAAYLNNLHKQLAEIIPAFHSYGDSQLHDLRNNQQWLKTMMWQLNSNNSHSEDHMMFQQYSANMAANLLAGISSMPQQNSESLNVSFLNPLLNVLTVLRNGDYRFVPLLISKINETLPKLANPMLQNVPDNVATKACNMDIFDGFGNAGMAQPPVLMDEYEKKYTPRMDEPPVDSGSSQGGSQSSNHEMNSPFMSSPSATSPGGEYSHGLPENSYNSMSGIMMNPMGASSSLSGQAPAHNPPQTPHTQHQPQQSISSMQNINTHMQHDMQHGLGTPIDHAPNMNVDHQNHNFGQQFSNGIAYMNAMSQGMNTNNLVNRQGPSRTTSFAMGPNPHTIRTVADFQALQRANSDISTMSSLGLSNGLGTEMDFMR